MFFVCLHPAIPGTSGLRLLFHVGGDEEDLGSSKGITQVRKEQRDCRLMDYIPSARDAFNALYNTEQTILRDRRALPSTESVGMRVTALRVEAIQKMRPHPTFLGRTREDGQAFNRLGSASKCCYVCKGMMGYNTYDSEAQGRKVVFATVQMDHAQRLRALMCGNCSEPAVCRRLATEGTPSKYIRYRGRYHATKPNSASTKSA
jgi:hypothetical protein